MEVQRFWKIIGIGGLIVNIGLVLTLILLSTNQLPPKPHGPGGPKLYIIHYLKLTEEQVPKYDEMVDNDRQFVFNTEKKIRDFRRKLYSQDLDELQINVLLDSISMRTRGIEKQRIFHIREIKSLCTSEEQKVLFNQLSKQLPELFAPKKGPKPNIPQNHRKP
jgi:hypothetical protein